MQIYVKSLEKNMNAILFLDSLQVQRVFHRNNCHVVVTMKNIEM